VNAHTLNEKRKKTHFMDPLAAKTVVRTLLEQRANILSLDVSVGSYDYLQECLIKAAHQRESRRICFANVHMVVEARRNPAIAKAVNEADWVVADGVPLLWAMRGLHRVRQERIAGMDIMATLLQRAADEGISVFFYGSTPDLLKRIDETCTERFPTLKIAGSLSPPFRPSTPEEDADTIKQITRSGAGLVFVALGCPKQELWMARVQGRVPAVMLGIGNALAVLVGEEERSPRWMQKVGLEWCFRLAREPRRLFKRYAVTNSLYVYYIIKQFVSRRPVVNKRVA